VALGKAELSKRPGFSHAYRSLDLFANLFRLFLGVLHC
jgi:hypothetical protein